MTNKLFTRNFSWVAAGQIVSILGSAILRFALDLYVLDITGRADIFALVIALSAIPGILFAPIGGAIVLTLIFLLGASYAPVVAVGVILAALSLISSIYQPTVQASVPLLVNDEQLAAANGIVSGVGALSVLLGPVLGGMLYGLIGLHTLVVASCVAFFLSAIMGVFIRIPFTKRTRDKNVISTIVGDMKIGMRYVTKGLYCSSYLAQSLCC